jgi:DNA mismatch endonuclease, patch repair protein
MKKRLARRHKAPSFRDRRSTSAAASRTMAANRSRGTKCEALLCAELRRMQLRFQTNVAALPGKPDIVFPRLRVAVFCDGDFWHGRRWRARKEMLARGSNASYWIAKIEANMRRDRRSRTALGRLGWRVLRVWESEILGDARRTAVRVRSLVVET